MSNNTVTATTTTEVKNEEEKMTISIEPIDFPSQAKCIYRSTVELANLVNSVFSEIMPDYAGCKIYQNDTQANYEVVKATIPAGGLYVTLTFRQSSENPTKEKNNIVPIANATKGSSLLERANLIMGKSASKTYEVTKWTTDILEKYINFRNTPRWNERIVERSRIADPNMFNQREEIVVEIHGLSLDLIIKDIFGEVVKNDDGTKTSYEYQAQVIKNLPRPQQTYISRESVEFLVQIIQLDTSITNQLSASLGFSGSVYGGYYGR